MYTSVAIHQFFKKFQEQFQVYNFVGEAIYTPEMDFSKLQPYILNNKTTDDRNKAWCGIIYTRQKATPGDPFYRKWKLYENFTDPETGEVLTYKCSQSACEVNFNIVSNELLHLEALENELQWFYDGRYEMTIELNKLPEFKLDIGDIVYGDFTKYESMEYGKLCSLGMACKLNYPILLRNNSYKVIKRFNYYLAKEMPNLVFYQSDISVPSEDIDKPKIILRYERNFKMVKKAKTNLEVNTAVKKTESVEVINLSRIISVPVTYELGGKSETFILPQGGRQQLPAGAVNKTVSKFIKVVK